MKSNKNTMIDKLVKMALVKDEINYLKKQFGLYGIYLLHNKSLRCYFSDITKPDLIVTDISSNNSTNYNYKAYFINDGMGDRSSFIYGNDLNNTIDNALVSYNRKLSKNRNYQITLDNIKY